MSTELTEDVFSIVQDVSLSQEPLSNSDDADPRLSLTAQPERHNDLNAMTPDERTRLSQCEEVLIQGMSTFFDVGNALLTIREAKLYRLTHKTFEEYCQNRWGMGRSYAWRMIGAAERLRLLTPTEDLPVPMNEFQMRPFLRLAPEDFPSAWKQVVERSNGRSIVQTMIQEVVNALTLSNPVSPDVNFKPFRRRHISCLLPLGHVLVLLHEIKQSIEKGNTERALAALNRIEDAFFGNSLMRSAPGGDSSTELENERAN